MVTTILGHSTPNYLAILDNLPVLLSSESNNETVKMYSVSRYGLLPSRIKRLSLIENNVQRMGVCVFVVFENSCALMY